ncbi:MAG: ABC transporter ATP-binding protein [bacterium]|nr:ABC transporter ATP-binding protein [bacterium]
MEEHLLDIRHLQTVFHTRDGLIRAVDDVTLHVDPGEIVGVVGESGSGKSVTMMSILKLIPMPPGEIVKGEAFFEGKDILQYKVGSSELRRVRGGGISMIFQEPMTSLNPVMTVGEQIQESVMLHLGMKKKEARERAIELLGMVGIPDSQSRIDYYPNQFSGGMRQRVMIAMAMSCNPRLLIADEATTALDVTTQEQILELLRDIVRKTHTALIIITHNLSIIARYADRIYVMYAGNIVERGACRELFSDACHPYTMGLLRAIPRLDSDKSNKLLSISGTPLNPAQKTGCCPFAPRCFYAKPECREPKSPPVQEYSPTHSAACHFRRDELKAASVAQEQKAGKRTLSEEPLLEVRHLCKYFPVTQGITRRKVGDVKALDDVSFTVRKGETLGLVGESGCGKTTLAKTLLRLYDASAGEIVFKGRDIAGLKENKVRDLRREVQFIFQDPFGSLDPRQSAGSVVGEAIRVHRLASSRAEYDRKVDELFEAVGLDPLLKTRAPHEFSGGQRQRLCIAGALASDPSFIICDEPISALDVSIQSQIINLLIDLQTQRGLTYLFIAHDLSVVRHVSDRILVMYLGKCVEISPWDELYQRPLHPYTQALLSAIPIPDPEAEAKRTHTGIIGEVPSLMNRPAGCVFHTRCPHATEKCRSGIPELRDCGNGHQVACFLADG